MTKIFRIINKKSDPPVLLQAILSDLIVLPEDISLFVLEDGKWEKREIKVIDGIFAAMDINDYIYATKIYKHGEE